MAPVRLARPPTCLDCLRRLVQPVSSSSPSPSPFLSLTQTRGVRTTKAELEDLQGIPVRLLKNIKGFGRKNAIIRVKPGRMRNIWFPKAQAEYMTRLRFKELGLTDAAIGVRDRTFGTQLILQDKGEKNVLVEDGPPGTRKSKETLTLPPKETLSLLNTVLPAILTFARKPIPAVSAPPQAESKPPASAPTTPRSPSIAANAAASVSSPTPTSPPAEPAPVAIFGSVSANDVLAAVKEKLLEADASQGARVALEADGVTILGLPDGEARVKRFGTFEVLISAGKDLEPVRRELRVVAEE
ncbi:hypothetical protein F4677DRAFT_428908 [Hypoxylon crocopeplum]|nr:hypothetical protein F4677DRAFT_428908 [Hypoxylon crocopeplum]